MDIFQEMTMTIANIIQQITANNAWASAILILALVLVVIAFVIMLVYAFFARG